MHQRTIYVISLAAICWLIIPKPAAADIYRFSPTEHRPILALSQHFAVEPLDVDEYQKDFFIECENCTSSDATIRILPRSALRRYRLLWYGGPSQQESFLHTVVNSSSQPLLVEERTADFHSYLITDPIIRLHVQKMSADAIVAPVLMNGIQFAEKGITVQYAPTAFKQPTIAALQQVATVALPDGYEPVTPGYAMIMQRPDAIEQTVPLTVKIQYTDATDSSKSIFYYDSSNGGWKRAQSYNNVEERHITAILPSITSTFVVGKNAQADDGIASWYAYKHCLCAASRQYPKGARLKVTRLKTGASVIVTVNDYGPEVWTGRLIDLDAEAFKKIGLLRAGIIYVSVEPIVENVPRQKQ